MGKSHKKVKNDRINAIRKQYDAFLEEDKMRRERNEYILGQLDKMRLSTALVPVSNKVNYHMEFNPSEMYIRPSNLGTKAEMRNTYVSHLGRQNVTTGLLSAPVEELRILKEISKKYILIPKRTKPIENEITYNKDLNDADWKTKYSILDDLKKLEKEVQSDPVLNQFNNDNNMHNKRLDLNTDCYTQPVNLGIHPNNFDTAEKDDELPIKKKLINDSQMEQDKVCAQVNFNFTKVLGEDNKIPLQIDSGATEKIIKDDQILHRHSASQEHVNNSQQDVTEKEKYDIEGNEKDVNSVNISDNNSHVSQMSNINNPTIYQENVNTPDCNESIAVTNEYIAPENVKEDIAHVAISNQTITEMKPQEPSTLTEIASLDQNIENQKDANVMGDFKSTESVELYDDVDPQGLIAGSETNFEKSHDHDPTQNINPVENIQPQEQNEHEAEIDAFEAEQREMFYRESHSPDAYSYIQNQSNTAVYPGEYEQNDQYAYYEGVQEQAYSTNINEHEESTERYDPHYNEQYEGSYQNQQPGYDNTNVYEQQTFQVDNPQFENIVNYENQQENVLPQDEQTYDQHLYADHPGTQEAIEQQLTAEEGYTGSPPVVTNAIPNETEYQIENETEYPIENETEHQIENEVIAVHQIENEGVHQIENEAVHQIENEAVNQIENEAVNQIENEAVNQIENEIVHQIENETVNQIENVSETKPSEDSSNTPNIPT